MKKKVYGEKHSFIDLTYVIMLKVHIGIASMRQFQCVPTTYVTEIKETYFEIYTKQVSCPLALPLLNI